MGRPKRTQPVNHIIGERIRQARKQHNPSLTQEELAQKIGASVTSVRNWEKGRFEPTSEYLQEISNICNVDVKWLQGLDVPTIIEQSLDIIKDIHDNPNNWCNIAPALIETNQKWAEKWYPIMKSLLDYFGYSLDTLNRSSGFYKLSVFMESEIQHSIETYMKIFNDEEKEKER